MRAKRRALLLAAVVTGLAMSPGVGNAAPIARSFVGGPSLDYVSPAGDFDGDGVADLIALEYWSSYNSKKGAVVARKGTDGSLLWARNTVWNVEKVIPAMVGIPPGPGAILVKHEWAIGTAPIRKRWQIDAIRRDGAIAWSVSFEVTTAATTGGASISVPRFWGTLRASPDGSDDLLISATTGTAGAYHSTAYVLDGQRGAIVGRTELASPATRLRLWPVSSVDGDQFGDYVVADVMTLEPSGVLHPLGSLRQSVAMLQAISGATGSRLWATTSDAHYFHSIRSFGDLTGDGRLDIAVADGTGTRLLDATDGSLVWRSPATSMWVVGDVDDDGTLDTGEPEHIGSASSSEYVHRTRSGDDGSVLREDRYAVPLAPGYYVRTAVDPYDCGDLDADGIREWCHALVSGDGTTTSESQGAFSGATGAQLWTAKPGVIAEGSFDGTGVDLIRTVRFDVAGGGGTIEAQDGATGAILWMHEYAGDYRSSCYASLSAATVDLTGDGILDVLASGLACDLDRGRIVKVLDGRTAETLWFASWNP